MFEYGPVQHGCHGSLTQLELVIGHLPGRSPSIIETTSDDHAALQTLPVSIKKLICVFRTLSSLDLKEFTDVASTALDGKQFHLLIREEVKPNVSR